LSLNKKIPAIVISILRAYLSFFDTIDIIMLCQ
jgi:hypothetical protein